MFANEDPRDGQIKDLRHIVDTLRAKLIESETWRTELRQEMDAVKGKLREVTGQRDEAVKAYVKQTDGRMPSYCPCCGGESMCDGCEPDCVLPDAIEAVFPGATR